MNKITADTLQQALHIPVEHIVREEYEMIVLKALFESEVGKSVVFKGGTALRLAYDCPRFSEDLDFSVLATFDKRACDTLLRSLPKTYPALTLKVIIQKRNTYFALFQVHEAFLVQSFSIKFEASTRPINWKRNIDYSLTVLKSKVTPLTVLAQVATLNRIEKDKLSIHPKRVRDIFDLWYIGQKLGKYTPMDFAGFDPKVVRRELHKFLPIAERRLIAPWLPA